MIRILLGIVIGILIGLIGILFTIDYYEDRYIKLRSEVILATGTDISYPYGYDEGRLNNSWFYQDPNPQTRVREDRDPSCLSPWRQELRGRPRTGRRISKGPRGLTADRENKKAPGDPAAGGFGGE